MKTAQIAAQMFTCREQMKNATEAAHTLRRVREAGYGAVQVGGQGAVADDELLKILGDEGLVCCATHEPGAMILDEPERVVERLAKLNCAFTAYPYPGGVEWSDPAAVSALITGLDKAGAVLRAAGMTLCYHNHHMEFRKLDGKLILETILDGTKQENLQGELDTYWVQYGGGDPVAWCERLPGRLPLLHLKDYIVNNDNQPTFCEIGAGNLDFKRIVSAAEKSGCQWFIVEQDTCPGDPVESLAQSYRYLTENICTD